MIIFSNQPSVPYKIARDYSKYIKFAWIPGLPLDNTSLDLYGTYEGANERALKCVANGYGGSGIRVYNFPVGFSPWTVIARVRKWTASSGTSYPGTLLNKSGADFGVGWNSSTSRLGMQYGSTTSYATSQYDDAIIVPFNSNKPTNISYQFHTSTFEQYSSNGIFIKKATPFAYSVNFAPTVDIGWMGGQSGKTFELLGIVVSDQLIPDKLVEYATGENFWGMFSPIVERKVYVQLSPNADQGPIITSVAGDGAWFGGGI